MADSKKFIALILPARNEARLIERALDDLRQQAVPAGFDLSVIVAVNGSFDETEAIANGYCESLPLPERARFQVLPIPKASKVGALNEAEKRFPNADIYIYLDVDVELSAGALSSIANRLNQTEPLLVAPSRCGPSDGSLLSRTFGAALCAMPWVAGDIVCGGIFATNAAGRARWKRFPPVGADDAFVFGHFEPTERVVLPDCTATHPIPNSLIGILKQQRRWAAAGDQLWSSPWKPPHTEGWPMGKRLSALARSPKAIAGLALIRSIRIASRLLPAPSGGTSWTPDR